jgi:hypothetical protein
MDIKALLLAIVGAVVAGFYALESYLSFQVNGFTAPILVKLLICGAGVYLLLRNAKRVKARPAASSANAA